MTVIWCNLFLVTIAIGLTSGQSIITTNSDLTLKIYASSIGSLTLSFDDATKTRLEGKIGLGLDVENATTCYGLENCLQFRDVQLHVIPYSDKGFTILWTTEDMSQVLRDCLKLNSSSKKWFGGPQMRKQLWPVHKMKMNQFPYVTQENNNTSIAEPYWLDSEGNFVFVDRRTPLFVDQNTEETDHLCFTAKQRLPYFNRKRIILKYTISAFENPREAHLHAINNFLGKSKDRPNVKLITNPIYSTWARSKQDINDSVILDFVDNIKRYRMPIGHFQIDDSWENCYGSQSFNSTRFHDILNTLWTLRYERFTVSLWVHPFINTNCSDLSDIGMQNGLFLKNSWGSTFTSWWNSERYEAHHLDFNKEEARHWFRTSLQRLQNEFKINGFKFDGGESSWAPYRAEIVGDVELTPNSMTTNYVRMAAEFGDLVDVRTGYNTQDLPVLVRMNDKESSWGTDKGLATLIPTLLQMNINGYTFVLPEMIGGNGNNGRPTARLYIRWLQATIFMPAMQFGYVPWDFEDETEIDVLGITRKYMDLREKFTNEVVLAMINCTERGHPVNGPIWWVDPNNPEAHKVEDQYLLGDNIMVAPVLGEKEFSRNIYMPKGRWASGANVNVVYKGPFTMSYTAYVDMLPFFVRVDTSAYDVLKRNQQQ